MPASIPPRLLASVAGSAAVVAVFFVAGFYPGTGDEVNVALGGLALLYGTWAFLAHGGGRITALGLFNLAFALFIGYGGINEGQDPERRTSPSYVALAITAALVVQILVNLAAWKRAAPSDEAATMPPLAGARCLTIVGGGGIILLFAAQRFGLPIAESASVDGTVFACVALFATGMIYRDDTRLLSRRVLYALAAFALYAAVFHQGTGRLRLVALACVVGLLLTARFPHRGIKWATVTGTPAAMWWLAQDRLTLQESIQPGASEGRTGLESMMSPIRVFAQILDGMSGHAATVDPTWGHTFLSVPFILVPEQLHPAWVPDALGYELVGLVAPAREGSGYSVVATVYGEWYWNFGWLGLILAIPVLAWLVGAVDARFRRSLVALAERPMALVRVVFWAMLAGGIADLAWSGTHTWVARHVARLPVLLLVATLIWLANRPAKATPLPWGRDAALLPTVLRERLDGGKGHAIKQ